MTVAVGQKTMTIVVRANKTMILTLMKRRKTWRPKVLKVFELLRLEQGAQGRITDLTVWSYEEEPPEENKTMISQKRLMLLGSKKTRKVRQRQKLQNSRDAEQEETW
jgi:hypothetical protein